MTEYTFSGEFKIGRETQEFQRTVEAESEEHGRDKIYSEICSEHSISRNKIELE